MVDFAALKRNRTDISKLVEAASQGNGERGGRNDDRFWQPTRDKAGNGYAVIRFLPGKADSGTPWVRYWDHAFKGPTGQWYIEKSLTSLGQPDPVGELNGAMWNNPGQFGMSENQAQALVRQRKRNLRYIANVLVVEDAANPENNGKVFLYRFGKRIFDKIMDAMQPKFPDETPINPFDLWDGADFVLKIRNVDNYPNYDKSEFKSASKLFSGDEARLEATFNAQHDVSEWTDVKNYKGYDELKSRLAVVLGESSPRTKKQEAALDDEIPYERLDNRQAAASEPSSAPAPRIMTAESSMDDDDDDLMAQFSALVNDRD